MFHIPALAGSYLYGRIPRSFVSPAENPKIETYRTSSMMSLAKKDPEGCDSFGARKLGAAFALPRDCRVGNNGADCSNKHFEIREH